MLTSPLPLATRGRYVDDTTTIKLLRNGSALTKSVSLGVHQLLVPESSSHRKTGMRCPDLRLPSYYIVGGLVFCTLCDHASLSGAFYADCAQVKCSPLVTEAACEALWQFSCSLLAPYLKLQQ